MIRQKIISLIKKSIKDLQKSGKIPQCEISEIKIEIPGKESHGDYATNIAMAIAKQAGKNPIEIANFLSEKLKTLDKKGTPRRVAKGKLFEKIKVAEPGFINFWISQTEIEKLYSEYLKRAVKIFPSLDSPSRRGG